MLDIAAALLIRSKARALQWWMPAASGGQEGDLLQDNQPDEGGCTRFLSSILEFS